MALSIKANQIAGPTTTGAFSSTDPGFQPKGMIVFGGLNSTTGAQADSHFALNWTNSDTTEFSSGYNSDDGVASSDVVRFMKSGAIYSAYTAGTVTNRLEASFTSFDATGFTWNIGTLSTASSVLMNYLCFGGDDITNVKSGSFSSRTTTGNDAVTGVGFQPDIVFLMGTLITTAGASNNNSQFTLGVMDKNGNQWTTATKAQNSQATMVTSRGFRNDKCFAMLNTTADTAFQEAEYVSMDADGFTINVSTAGGTAILISYLAVKGGQWKVGSDTQQTSATTKATTGVGFTPSAILFSTACDTQAAGYAATSRRTMGLTSGTSNNVSHFVGDRDNVPDALANSYIANNKCLTMCTENGTTSVTVNAEAALSSFDSDGFTLNWTTADATARYFGYVAIGANAVVTGTKKFSLLGVG